MPSPFELYAAMPSASRCSSGATVRLRAALRRRFALRLGHRSCQARQGPSSRRRSESTRAVAVRLRSSRAECRIVLYAARSQEARFKGLRREAKVASDGDARLRLPHAQAPGATIEPTAPEETLRMPSHTPPQPDELDAYAAEARASQVRIATDRGDIVVELFPDDVLMHAAAFLKVGEIRLLRRPAFDLR